MHTLFVTSEFSPFAKAGGLGDAVASLASALGRREMTVSVLMPRYGAIEYAAPVAETRPLEINFGTTPRISAIEKIALPGVNLYLLKDPDLYNRPGIYGPNPAQAYQDNLRRFSVLSFAALALAETLDPAPDVIHAHDWPAALVPALLASKQHCSTNIAGVLSIHNFGHQGTFSEVDESEIGLSGEEMQTLHIGRPDSINLLRSALHHADRIVAVSPRYALEIQQPRFGFGLHREVQARTRDVRGILNGIDQQLWGPEEDPYIGTHFSKTDRNGKIQNKEDLQRAFGLPIEPEVPLIGMVTRLVKQKGIGLLFEPGNSLIHELCSDLPIQFAIIGSGEEWCEHEIGELSRRLPNFRGIVGYSEEQAHMIEAGADFFLMPSLYEPCGLNQMYSMRYGTLPIVTRTGGLADTVDGDSGFFIEESSATAIRFAVTRAIDLYLNDRPRIEEMREYAMGRDFGWDHSAGKYEQLYTELIADSNERLVSV